MISTTPTIEVEREWNHFDGECHCILKNSNCCVANTPWRHTSALRVLWGLENSNLHLAFAPRYYNREVTVDALGFGIVTASYSRYNDDTVTVYAHSLNRRFVGWFMDGELVSTAHEYTFSCGGELKANFGGDVNFDGQITAFDALLVLRHVLGISELDVPSAAMDVTGNGLVDANDALTIMRLALGLA